MPDSVEGHRGDYRLETGRILTAVRHDWQSPHKRLLSLWFSHIFWKVMPPLI